MGNSSSQIINSINNTIATNILNSIQTVQKTSTLTQSISGECDSEVITSISTNYNECIFNWVKVSSDSDVILDICSPITKLCSMTNISLESSINILDTSISESNITQLVQQNITNFLKQYNTGSNTDMLINNINDEVTTQLATIIQNLKNTTTVTQTIELKNVKASFISLKNATSIITNTLQSDSILQKSISDISNTITQTSDNSSSYFTVFYLILAIIIIVWIIIKCISLMSISANYTEFFNKIIPYLGFIISSTVVVVIYLYVKPSYVTYIDVNGNKNIDKKNFGLVIALYIIVFGLIFYIINWILNKK